MAASEFANFKPATVAGEALWQWWQWARQAALAAEIDPAEADWLLRAVSEVDGLALKLGSFKQRSSISVSLSLDKLTELWHQRVKQRVPVQYLVGLTEWRDLKLQVSPAVLIPRPETELLIDLVVETVRQHPDRERLQQGAWVDLGTGSGAIALALAQALPTAPIYAVDLSVAALAIAQANAQQNGLTHRVTFCHGSWLAPLAHHKGQLAGLVSNPPYIPTATVQTLQPEVRQHEPTLALDGGNDGLESLRQLVEIAPDYLLPGGLWLVEMMAGQADTVRTLLEQQGAYRDIQIRPDLAGIERFGLAIRR